jgi:MFS family permease
MNLQYVTIMLETNVGLPRETASLVAGCIQIAFWLGTFPPMFLLDRIGRRPMLLFGSVGLLVTMAIFTAGIAVNTQQTANLALAMLFCYEISFGMSWNSIPWLYAVEITPLRLRHVGSSIATFSEWLWTFVGDTISHSIQSPPPAPRGLTLAAESLTSKDLLSMLGIVNPSAGHCSYLAICYCEFGVEILPTFCGNDYIEYTGCVFLSTRGANSESTPFTAI